VTLIPAGFTGTRQLLPECAAVYTIQHVDVSADHDHEVVVPLPAGTTLTEVVALNADGTEQLHRFSDDPGGVLIFVPARTGPISAIRIRWKA